MKKNCLRLFLVVLLFLLSACCKQQLLVESEFKSKEVDLIYNQVIDKISRDSSMMKFCEKEPIKSLWETLKTTNINSINTKKLTHKNRKLVISYFDNLKTFQLLVDSLTAKKCKFVEDSTTLQSKRSAVLGRIFTFYSDFLLLKEKITEEINRQNIDNKK